MADAMASGVESTWPRQKILSASSMTQIDVSFSDTSRPTYCLLWDMVSLLWRCGEASLYRQWLPRDYAMSRPQFDCAIVSSGGQGWPRFSRPPEGLVLDGRESDGTLAVSGRKTCVAAKHGSSPRRSSRLPGSRSRVFYRSPETPIGKSIDYLDFATIELPGPA